MFGFGHADSLSLILPFRDPMEWKNLAVLRAGRVDQVMVLVNKTFLYFFEEHFFGASLVPVKMDQKHYSCVLSS